MILSATTSHALRALAYLAAVEDGSPVQGRDLARKVKVPVHYLAKVMGTLARAGVVVATRGARGGYRLAKQPNRIRLADVVEPLEGPRARPRCVLKPDRPCNDSADCSAHACWKTVGAAYGDFLDRTTLADIQSTD